MVTVDNKALGFDPNEYDTNPVEVAYRNALADGLERLNRDIVIWRDKSGKLNAVEDFCPHRGARLSLGHVCDGDIACEYHGVQVNGQGVVTATPPTPGSPMVGKKLISSYPIEQR